MIIKQIKQQVRCNSSNHQSTWTAPTWTADAGSGVVTAGSFKGGFIRGFIARSATYRLVFNVFSILLSLLLALVGSNALAQSESGDDNLPDFSHVQQQAMELKQSVLTYSESQRQALIAETEAALQNFDRRTDKLEATIAAREDEMSGAAERYARNMLATLNRQRADFEDWLATLQSDSRGAWDEVMHGFSNAYDEFYNSWENLESEFGSSAL